MFFAALTLAFDVTILNPTSNSKWAPGEEVTIIWSTDSDESGVSFNLIDLTNGNEDAPFLAEISEDVDLTEGRLEFTVPEDVEPGKVGIQILAPAEKPLYSSTFEIEGDAESAESAAAVMAMTAVGAIILQ